MIKFIAIDMDGTLLTKDKKILDLDKEAIQKTVEKDVEVVMCTGRPKFGALPLYNQLELSDKNKYIILNNGASIYETKTMKLLDYSEIDRSIIQWLYDLKKGFNIDFTLTTEEHFYFVVENEDEEPNETTVFDSKSVFTPLTKITIEEAMKNDEIIFKTLFTGYPEEMDKFEKTITDEIREKVTIVRSQPYIIEALPLDTTKKTGLEKLLNMIDTKYEKEEMMAIGDENNDIEMLEFVGVGVAMGNAKQHIKDMATYVTDTNENNGVAKALDKFIVL